MINFWTRRKGSQRPTQPVALTVVPNFAGYGDSSITLFDEENGKYYVLDPETTDDIRKLQSAIGVASHNMGNKG